MSEKERDVQVRSATIIPLAERMEGDLVEGLSVVAGTDDEIIHEAVNAFEEETGAVMTELTPDQAKMTIRRFAFSSSTWNAPWEPTGPKSPGKPRLN